MLLSALAAATVTACSGLVTDFTDEHAQDAGPASPSCGLGGEVIAAAMTTSENVAVAMTGTDPIPDAMTGSERIPDAMTGAEHLADAFTTF